MKENYRPVSCLPGGSKLLERIVCEQTTKYMEENQHGFRAKRSTMTAWANIQQDWAQNTEEKQITGIILFISNNHYNTYLLTYLLTTIWSPGSSVGRAS